MRTVHIDHRNAELEAAGKKIVVRANGQRKATIPMRLIERLVVSSNAKIASSLLLKLNRQGTGVLVVPTRYNKDAAPLHITQARNDPARQWAQLQTASNVPACLQMAVHFVVAKLRGHLVLLNELAMQRPRHQRTVQRACDLLAASRQRLDQPIADKDQLRGIEGAASAHFFKAWGKCLPAALNFATRNRRPPLDPANVCLSIGYTLAHHEALIAANVAGLDPHIGFLHDPLANRDSLACDIVEATRPVIDRWVFDLFATRTLRPDHFSTTDMSCLVGKAGRKLIYESYFTTTADKIVAICNHHADFVRTTITSFAPESATTP